MCVEGMETSEGNITFVKPTTCYMRNLKVHSPFIFTIGIIIMMSLLVSCNNKRKQTPPNVQVSELANDNTTSFVTYSFEGPHSFDTLTIDNIIKSVRYIPLETSDNCYIDRIWRIESYKGNLLINHGSNYVITQIKMFDSEGRYIRNLFNIGRGPNELTGVLNWTSNEQANEVVIIGMDKNLVCNLETNQINHYTQYKSDDGNVSTSKYILLPDGHIASLNNNRNNGETLKPYLVLFDPIFQPIKYYSDKKKRVADKKRREHEGEIIYDLTEALTKSPYGALYRDMINDTVFAVYGKDVLKPAFALGIPEKKRPTLDYDPDNKTKQSKLIYHEIFYPFESEDYIFDGYFYDEKCYNVIWKKGNPEPLYQSADDRFGYRIKADGKTYFVEMVYSCTDNKIYVPISPAEAVRKVSGIKPDDNPVIMEITLKD